MKKIILIAEDDRPLNEGLSISLEKHVDAEIINCLDGYCAIYHIVENKDQDAVLLLDLSMPKMNGKDILNFMEHTKIDMPTIIISNNDMLSFTHQYDRYSFVLGKMEKAETSLAKIAKTVLSILDGHTKTA